MDGWRTAELPATVAARAWRPGIAGIREVFHARFVDHAYPPHTHDAWTLFLVDAGGIRYDLDRRPRAARSSTVSALPPHLVHDGRPATAAGYAMRVLYLEPTLLGDELIGPAVDRPVIEVPGLAASLSRIHDLLACRDDLLEAETWLALALDEAAAALRGRARRATAEHHAEADRALAEALRAYLDRHAFEPVTLAAAAAALGGASPTRLARSFRRSFGAPPHGYVLGRRLEAARGRILDGAELADVATAVGFVDQAHLTRRFRQYFGTTPAQIRRRDATRPRARTAG